MEEDDDDLENDLDGVSILLSSFLIDRSIGASSLMMVSMASFTTSDLTRVSRSSSS